MNCQPSSLRGLRYQSGNRGSSKPVDGDFLVANALLAKPVFVETDRVAEGERGDVDVFACWFCLWGDRKP